MERGHRAKSAGEHTVCSFFTPERFFIYLCAFAELLHTAPPGGHQAELCEGHRAFQQDGALLNILLHGSHNRRCLVHLA